MKYSTDEKLLCIENTEVYNIICDSLAIEPKANNGTLRLPLKPIGLHSAQDDEAFEEPDENQAGTKTVSHILDKVQTLAASAFTTPASVVTAINATDATGNINSTALPGTNQTQNEAEASDSNIGSTSNFWDYLIEKVEAIKAWANAKISGATNHAKSAQTSD